MESRRDFIKKIGILAVVASGATILGKDVTSEVIKDAQMIDKVTACGGTKYLNGYIDEYIANVINDGEWHHISFTNTYEDNERISIFYNDGIPYYIAARRHHTLDFWRKVGSD